MMEYEPQPTDELTWKDAATVNGDHKQVASMAVLLHEQGKSVKVSRGNFSSRLREDGEYWVEHDAEKSRIMTEGGPKGETVHEHVTDESHLYVTEHYDR